MSSIHLRIVVYPETPRTWTARLLEHDLSAVGRSIELATGAVLKLAMAHIVYDRRHQHKPLSVFAAAPALYWTAFKQATPLPLASEIACSGDECVVQVNAAVLARHPAVTAYVPCFTRGA